VLNFLTNTAIYGYLSIGILFMLVSITFQPQVISRTLRPSVRTSFMGEFASGTRLLRLRSRTAAVLVAPAALISWPGMALHFIKMVRSMARHGEIRGLKQWGFSQDVARLPLFSMARGLIFAVICLLVKIALGPTQAITVAGDSICVFLVSFFAASAIGVFNLPTTFRRGRTQPYVAFLLFLALAYPLVLVAILLINPQPFTVSFDLLLSTARQAALLGHPEQLLHNHPNTLSTILVSAV
jgi:hypothetical protein